MRNVRTVLKMWTRLDERWNPGKWKTGCEISLTLRRFWRSRPDWAQGHFRSSIWASVSHYYCGMIEDLKRAKRKQLKGSNGEDRCSFFPEVFLFQLHKKWLRTRARKKTHWAVWARVGKESEPSSKCRVFGRNQRNGERGRPFHVGTQIEKKLKIYLIQ